MIALILPVLLHLHLHMITRMSNNTNSPSTRRTSWIRMNPDGTDILFYILHTTPKSMSLTPSRTVAFFTITLGFPTSPALRELSGISFPFPANH